MATTIIDKSSSKSEKSVNADLTTCNMASYTNKLSDKPLLGELAIEASEIVSRLEQVAEGVPVTENAFTVFLGLEKKHTDEILHIINGLISTDDEGVPYSFPPLGSVAKLVMISHTLQAYCGGLDRAILQKISTRFTTDTTRWISQIFGFLDSTAFYHEDQLEGLVRVCRMMLYYKYPRYFEDGALAFTESLPTIYSSVISPLGIVQHLCKQLGLPLACIRPVPVNTHFGSQYTMDVAQLQKMLAEDVAVGRTPIVVIADVGTPITGHVDNISRIKELCKVHDVWLHLRGHTLAALALPNHQPNGHNGSVADSMTLCLSSWLGIPSLPMVTLTCRQWDATHSSAKYKQVGATRESTLPFLAGLHNDHSGRRILSMPLWVAFQSLGTEGVHSRIRDNFLASERLWAALNDFRHLRVLSTKPGGESGTYTVSELMSKPANIPLLFESTSSSVVFQYTPDLKEGETLTKVPAHYDKLNSWLGQILQIEVPQVPISLCEDETVGVVLRYCPFENALDRQPTPEEIQTFIQCLEQQLIILRATLHHKETFVKLVEESPVLQLVDLPDWAGMGGVRYAPEGWEELLTVQAKDELNHLNMALVDSLRSTDAAFSLGEDADGLLCVRFGMLTPQSDVEELLNLVIKVGQSVEENSRVLDSMSEIVRKGIETATLDLQKENEEKLWQEGILRHVPVVGTFVNWWSPKTKETGVRGRSLNLTQGVVESTENIYKYHMQIQSGTVPQGAKNPPPTPQVQTPIGGSHSRSSSHASSQGTAPCTVSIKLDNEKNNVEKVAINAKKEATDVSVIQKD